MIRKFSLMLHNQILFNYWICFIKLFRKIIQLLELKKNSVAEQGKTLIYLMANFVSADYLWQYVQLVCS